MNRDLWYIATLATLLAGCSGDVGEAMDPDSSDGEYGVVAISASVESGVIVRSEAVTTYELPSELLPSADDLRLTIECGGELYAEYSSLSAYNSANSDGETYSPPMLPGGEYTFTLSSGEDESVEGETNACFEGSATIVVVARDYEMESSIGVALSNSMVRLSTTEMFDSYFAGGATLILSTEGGTTIEYDTAKGISEVLFVAPSTTLYLEGEGVKQAPTEDDSSAPSVTFQRSEIGVTTPGGMTSVVVDAESVGGSSIVITFDDTINYIPYDTIDLNLGGGN